MKTIIAAVDFSDSTNDVLSMAKKMALTFGGEVVVLHTVVPKSVVNYYYGVHGPFYMQDAIEEESREGTNYMDILKHMLEKARVSARTILIEGSPAIKILDEAKILKADLIIAGAHKHGALYHLFVGNVSGKLIHQSPCPVLVIPHKENPSRV